PETWISDPAVRRRLEALAPPQRMAAAELLSCAMKVHVCYAVPLERGDDPLATPADDAVPVLRDLDAAALARTLKPGVPLTVRFDGVPLALPLPNLAGPIAARVDGRRTVAEIRCDLQATVDRRLTDAAFADAFQRCYDVLNGIN